MSRGAFTPQRIGACLVALIATGLLFLADGENRTLVQTGPDLGWPLGLLGVGGGLWSAYHITRLPTFPQGRFSKLAVLVTIPMLLSYGLVTLDERIRELASFRHGALPEDVTVRVIEKTSPVARGSSRTSYNVDLANPFGGPEASLRVDAETHRGIDATRCVTILIERAPDGAARVVKPVRWNVPCVSELLPD